MATGRSDITLKIEIVLNVLALGLLGISVFWFRSILWIAWSNVITECVSLCLFMYSVKKIIGYSIRDQLADMLPGLLLSGMMGILVVSVKVLPVSGVSLLVFQILSGAMSYVIGAFLCKMDAFRYLLKMLYERKHLRVLVWMIHHMDKEE